MDGPRNLLSPSKSLHDLRVIIRPLVWDSTNGLTPQEQPEPSPVSSHTRSKITHFFHGRDGQSRTALEAAAAKIGPESFKSTPRVMENYDDDYKCIICGHVSLSGKQLLKHVKVNHPRVSDSSTRKESRLKRRSSDPDNTLPSC